jgi:adenylate cyclase
LAILPLENLSGDTEQKYFADGMAAELMTEIAKIRSLHVISRTSAMRYKRTRKPLVEIARANLM